MMPSKKQYCTISEFAKLCGVGKQTLQYYDRLGIFSPEWVDDNGYRYYAFYQLDAFRILMALKAINTPLKTIKDYLKHRSQDELIALLKEQQQKIGEEIRRLQLAGQIIDNKLAQVRYANAVDFTSFRLVCQPMEQLVLSDELPQLDDKQYSQVEADHIHFCDQYQLNTGCPIGSIITREHLLACDLRFCYWFTRVRDDYHGPKAFTKPKGWYAIGYYQGYYGSEPERYFELMEYIAKQGFHISGHAYENSVVDMFMAESTDDYITEIAIQVAPD